MTSTHLIHFGAARKNAHLLYPVCRVRCLARVARRQRETRRRRQIAA
jgi:hypothetical protein